MPYKKYPPLNKKNLKTISINDRKSLVEIDSFAQPFAPGASFESFMHSLPHSLSAKDLLEFSIHVKNARKKDSLVR
jgi:hypothetical protein